MLPLAAVAVVYFEAYLSSPKLPLILAAKFALELDYEGYLDITLDIEFLKSALLPDEFACCAAL